MRRLLLVLTILTALTATGCNSSQTTRRPNLNVSITTRDFRLSPQNVEVRHGLVTFVVSNAGREPHNLKLRGRGHKRGGIATLRPGATGAVTMRLKRGSYTMYCSVGRHETLGEYGTVVVR